MKSQEKIFYYSSLKLGVWFAVNAAALITVVFAFLSCWCLYYWWEAWMVLALVGISFVASAWVYFFPQPLAVITRQSIKIDRSVPLLWKDVAFAEEKDVRCCLRRKHIIVFHLRGGVDYPLNFMQKLCRNSCFTAFSIPLYAMSAEDGAEIKRQIADYAEYRG